MFKFFCCQKKHTISEDDFLNLCRNGNLNDVIKYTKYNKFDLDKGLLESVKTGQIEICKFLIENGASELNVCLKSATNNFNYHICELLIQKGANPDICLKYSKSVNITKMAYRYKQNSNLIN